MAIVCDHCQATNPDGSLYCANCSWQLIPPEEDDLAVRPAVAPGAPPPHEASPAEAPQDDTNLEQKEIEIQSENAAESPAKAAQPGDEVPAEEPAPAAPPVTPPPEPELTTTATGSTGVDRFIPILSRGMLILGVLLILGGLGWMLWTRLNAPPEPVFTDAGAVVLAVTAPPRATNTAAAADAPVSADVDTATDPASTGATPAPADATPTAVAKVVVTATPSPTPTPAQSLSASDATPSLLPAFPEAGESPVGTPTVPIADSTALPTTAPTPTPTRETPEPTALPTVTPTPQPTATPTPTPRPQAEDPPVRVVAPAIDLDAQVVPMTWEMVTRNGAMSSEWIVPKQAAGWHVNSALPGHGENVVLSGHHNIEGKVFRYVVDLEPGDEVKVYSDGVPYIYTVEEKYILRESGMPLDVRRKNAQWIMPAGEERLTLVTCWPYEWPGNSHRVIVVARPVEPSAAEDLEQQ